MPFDLPPALAGRLDELLAASAPRELERTASELSDRYRSGGHAPLGESEVRAYAAYRLPATYAATAAAVEAVREQVPDWAPLTALDLGAGLGAATWAAASAWPSLQDVHAVDAAQAMLAFGRDAASALRPHVTWEHADLRRWRSSRSYDLVLVSYVLGELAEAEREALLANAWSATGGLLLVVEPGTPDGYGRVIAARAGVIQAGGFTTAPCPHDRTCPMLGTDWCHFAVRLPRSARHRAAKGAQLGYEDEKFSYVAASRSETSRADARVVRHPQARRGHVYLELCAGAGLRTELVSKRDGETYRRARKAAWGDSFDS
ncbi:MAG TPA: small ribosomal subunit Rsm22 family protein [Gaiellaceae bacterium]|jgi:ribosomal protein RSM22 (predicted rRNA methylase)